MTAHVLQGDALNLPLPDSSVDLIVTSPPYFALRSYTDQGRHYGGQVGGEDTPQAYVHSLLVATAECIRVLKPSGSLWVNLGDKYARTGGVDRKQRSAPGSGDVGNRKAGRLPQRGVGGVRDKSLVGLPWRYALGCIDTLGLILRAEVVWAKPNGLPESVTDRVRRSHETWFHFTLQPRYYSAVDEVREQAQARPGAMSWAERKAAGEPPRRGEQGANDATVNGMAPHALGRVPGSVWTVATSPLRLPAELGVSHFAAFPPEWPRRIVAGWSPPGGTVLDLFGGTGTTALVASVLGRTGISVDMSHDYGRVARWRTSDLQQRAKVQALHDKART